MLENFTGDLLLEAVEEMVEKGQSLDIIFNEQGVAQNLIEVMNKKIRYWRNQLDDNVELFDVEDAPIYQEIKEFIKIFTTLPELLVTLSQFNLNSNRPKLNVNSFVKLLFTWSELFQPGANLLSAIPRGKLKLNINVVKVGILEVLEQDYIERDPRGIVEIIELIIEHLSATEKDINKVIALSNTIRSSVSYLNVYIDSGKSIPANWPIDIITCQYIFDVLKDMTDDVRAALSKGEKVDSERSFYDFIHGSLSAYEQANTSALQHLKFVELKQKVNELGALLDAPKPASNVSMASFVIDFSAIFTAIDVTPVNDNPDQSLSSNNNNNNFHPK